MADTTSIASRMEKLAQLKRMKEELTSEPAATPVEPAPEQEAPISSFEEFENLQASEPVISTEFSDLEDVDLPTLEDPVLPDDSSTLEDPADLDPTDFDHASAWDEDESLDASPALDEAVPSADGRDVNFVIQNSVDLPDDVPSVPEETFETTTPDAEAVEEDFQPNSGLSAAALGIDDDELADFDEIAAISSAGGAAAAAATASSAFDESNDVAPESAEDDLPDFAANEVDAEMLKREFEGEVASEQPADDHIVDEPNPSSPVASEDSESRISVSFDESRSTLLNHVSRQMGCSVEDVVVTALDWYLDALFGEDEEAKSA